MTYDLTGTQPPLRGRGALVTGAVLLVVGIVAVVAGVVGFASTAGSLLSQIGTPKSSPTSFTRSLDGGTTYAVYEETSAGSGTTGDPLVGTVQPGDVTVSGPSGEVPVTDAGSDVGTVQNGPRVFAEVATFDPPSTGQYTIQVATRGALVAVAPSVTSVGKTLGWIGLIGLGGLLALVGIIVLIVGAVQRSSSRRGRRITGAAAAYPEQPSATYPAQPAATYPTTVEPAPEYAPPVPPALPPAGWYPDPERPGGQRYWDGSAWTEHRA